MASLEDDDSYRDEATGHSESISSKQHTGSTLFLQKEVHYVLSRP